jgi:hypothetical protein
MGVGGASYDALYLMTPTFSLPDGSSVVAYGSNHVATGKASYSSVVVTVDPDAVLTLKSENHVELQGSARDFTADQQVVDQFYAWSFSRAGGSGPQGPHVTPLASATSNYCEPYGTDRPVEMDTVQVFYRAYAEPTTRIRPAHSELLLDGLLLFTPK